jgi:hypothetical protein
VSDPDPVETYLARLDELIARGEAMVGVSRKTIAQVTRDYGDTLDRFVRDVLQRGGGEIDFRRAHKALIRSSAQPAYIEGMREAGGSEEDMDDDDRAAIQAWIDEQVSYVDAFAAAIRAASLSDAPAGAADAILARVPVWAASLESLGGLGKASILESRPGIWRLGETEEHCETCAGLHGQRHRLRWFTSRGLIPRQPGSETLQCKVYRCD